MMPWKLYSDAAAYIFTWLLGYSSLMGALGGILIADYWVVRRQHLSLPDLFREDGAYRYRRGVNPRAMVALAAAVIPVIPGFVRAATTPGGVVAAPDVFDRLYSYAWFVTFALGSLTYLWLMRGERRREWGMVAGPGDPELREGSRRPDVPRSRSGRRGPPLSF